MRSEPSQQSLAPRVTYLGEFSRHFQVPCLTDILVLTYLLASTDASHLETSTDADLEVSFSKLLRTKLLKSGAVQVAVRDRL